MWANMRIIVLLTSLKVGVTRSLRTRQMLKVDLCANGAGAYAPYAPPLPTGLGIMIMPLSQHDLILKLLCLHAAFQGSDCIPVSGDFMFSAGCESDIYQQVQ